jgi:two-component system, cell cycle sensor histidine kinase and response regulator CckA
MEAIGQLAGGIAHDFNNILTAILGYSDLLLTGPPGAVESIRPELEQIKRAAERAGSLTRQILAFSRRQALNPQVVSLNEILSGMEPLLRRTLGEHIDFVCELEHELGLTELDAHQFEQVLMNLAVNALDAMPAGGRLTFATSNVEIDGKTAALPPELSAGRYVMLTVQDTGVGMDEATTSRVFEPFFTTKETGKGTGLGLSTVYGTVRQSGSSVTVDSRVGEGSRFTLYLPRVFSAAREQEEPGRPSPQSEGGETVMVVEDEVSLQDLISTALVSFGYRVIVAGSGSEALEVLARQQSPPDLLLTDVVLPGGVQGHELAEQLRLMVPDLPVLFMSGYPRDYIVHGGRLDQGVHFLQKPFTPRELQVAIRGRLAAAS